MKVSNMNNQANALVLVVFVLVLSGTFQCCSSYAYEPHDSKETQTLSPNQLESSVFRLSGSVHQGHYYSPGHGDILFDGKVTHLKQLDVVFDSGSTYTIFAPHAYTATLHLVRKSLRRTPLIRSIHDTFLPVCWKGPKRYRVLGEVRNYFKHMALRFSRTNNAQFQLPPEAYLIISPSGNVCFGIFNGAHSGLENLNLIGDISLQDKLVIYDNERELIGWVPSNCNARVAHHPNSNSTFQAESPAT